MIPLMKFTFINEYETKEELIEFIRKTSKFSMGEKCLEFEQGFSRFQGRRYSVLFNSGASANLALLQSLKNLGRIKEGDNVGFSALTWATNVMPIIQIGLNPIPVDCSVNTLNVMSNNLLATLEKYKLRVLFITNALGFAGDLLNIKEICNERGIILIEDNCESLGTELYGTKTGNFGLASTFSFFVAHHMSTIEGGMVSTDDEELYDMLIIVRANGWDRNLRHDKQIRLRKAHNILSEFEAKYTFYDLAFNMRPTEITGFLGLTQLKYLSQNIEKRNQNYQLIEAVIEKNSDLILISHEHISKLSPFATVIVCKSKELRDKYLYRFSGAGIEIRPVIAGNIQRQPFFKKYININVDLPSTDFIHYCGFYCGNYPELTDMDIETIISCLHKLD